MSGRPLPQVQALSGPDKRSVRLRSSHTYTTQYAQSPSPGIFQAKQVHPKTDWTTSWSECEVGSATGMRQKGRNPTYLEWKGGLSCNFSLLYKTEIHLQRWGKNWILCYTRHGEGFDFSPKGRVETSHSVSQFKYTSNWFWLVPIPFQDEGCKKEVLRPPASCLCSPQLLLFYY